MEIISYTSVEFKVLCLCLYFLIWFDYFNCKDWNKLYFKVKIPPQCSRLSKQNLLMSIGTSFFSFSFAFFFPYFQIKIFSLKAFKIWFKILTIWNEAYHGISSCSKIPIANLILHFKNHAEKFDSYFSLLIHSIISHHHQWSQHFLIKMDKTNTVFNRHKLFSNFYKNT